MNPEDRIEALLRWRLACAEADAPPAPRAARLLELARPWWERWPKRFRALAERVGSFEVGYGHAMVEPLRARTGHPVPALIVRTVEELETSVRLLYLSVSGGRLRLRFQLDASSARPEEAFEVTFLSETSLQPLFDARASASVESEYRIDAELPRDLAVGWEELKVTDRMPFRLILRADSGGA